MHVAQKRNPGKGKLRMQGEKQDTRITQDTKYEEDNNYTEIEGKFEALNKMSIRSHMVYKLVMISFTKLLPTGQTGQWPCYISTIQSLFKKR